MSETVGEKDVILLQKDGYQCINHKDIEEKLSELRDEMYELKIAFASLKDTKADKEELWKLREKLMELQEGVSEIKHSLTEIKNNSEEDRSKRLELISELVETNRKMTILESDYGLFRDTHEKMNLFFETSISFQIGKVIKQSKKVLDTLKKSSATMKFTINCLGWVLLASIVWGLISMFMYLTNQTLPIEKVIELVRLLLGK